MATIPFTCLGIPIDRRAEQLPRLVGRIVTERGRTIGRVTKIQVYPPEAEVALIGAISLKNKGLTENLELINSPT